MCIVQIDVGELPVDDFFLFPKSLGQLIRTYGVHQLHLSLSSGRWRHDRWDYPHTPRIHLPPDAHPPPSPQTGPTGAELFIELDNHTHSAATTPADRLASLLSGLTGLLCASLNTLTVTSTSQPHLLYPTSVNSTSYYATLPREAVCTENLTPLYRLLPCRNAAGIGRLLHSVRVFDSLYRSLQVRWVSDGASGGVLVLVVMAVMGGGGLERGWSVKELFDEPSVAGCSVAARSEVWVHLQPWVVRRYPDGVKQLSTAAATDNTERLVIKPSHTALWSAAESEDVMLLYDLQQWPDGLQLSLRHHTAHSHSLTVPPSSVFVSRPAVLVQRYLTGTNAYLGALHAEIQNAGDETQTLIYYDCIPSAQCNTDTRLPSMAALYELIAVGCCVVCCSWYVKLFFHTMRLTLNGVQLDAHRDLLSFRVQAAEHRGRPAEIELAIKSEAHLLILCWMNLALYR